jgi:leucyl/phenylalanyl-tRNA--protein transferase
MYVLVTAMRRHVGYNLHMPVFELTEELAFPLPEHAEASGLLALGGDLSAPRLLLAYSMGIFPWYSEGQPILWWSPDPRLVLIPGELKVSRSLRQTIRKNTYSVTVDRAFSDVIRLCADIHRAHDGGTWITGEMAEAYTRLHRLGVAHSVESWRDGELAGGLYGVALGAAFFGESMFSLSADASKVAFVALVRRLIRQGFRLVDCQVSTAHLKGFGARDIPRAEFMRLLRDTLGDPLDEGGKWGEKA